jgi:hypothetical protein
MQANASKHTHQLVLVHQVQVVWCKSHAFEPAKIVMGANIIA